MSLFKRPPAPPAIELYRSNGESTQLHVTFKNGEIHINPDAMDKGNYLLTVSQGKERLASQSFTIS